ncbi:flavin reductase family protein [Mycolicibacterium mengxianglii]|uniref:flavin reductase family protein n=1 Tax=Mycolicibacterium mengxianglii TaxID=2736649 RepID=UPI0018EEDD70|nr:iron-sulfur cluster-binding domain-containing protein [Mycolicibacterium mengxianglii]
MFTQMLVQRVLGSPLVDLLTGPHGVDRYTELLRPTWTLAEARATVLDVRRDTASDVTLMLQPNAAFTGFKAGQYVTVSVEVDGRRHTRCYSPANAEGSALLELTIRRHDRGRVSGYLYDRAAPGLVLGLSAAQGAFVLPTPRPRRILFVAGGSGITPIVSMLRTLRAEGFTGQAAVLRYAPSAVEAAYRHELQGLNVTVLHGFTRDAHGTDVVGRFGPAHLASAMADPDAVFVCGPPGLVEAVGELCPGTRSESFVPPAALAPIDTAGGRLRFTDSAVEVTDDGRSLLDQAEAAGLAPQSGCRMGICHTCTRRKTRGAVRDLTTGAVSGTEAEDVQICVSAPVGDVEVAL